jgi:hypothetical protein
LAKTSGNDSPKGEIAPRDKPPILKKSRRLNAITFILSDRNDLRKPEK